MQPYEDMLEEQEVKTAVWSDYLDFFPSFHLYERALMDCGMEEHFLLRYLKWLQNQSFGLDTQNVVRSLSVLSCTGS